jgi:hypothetical protein
MVHYKSLYIKAWTIHSPYRSALKATSFQPMTGYIRAWTKHSPCHSVLKAATFQTMTGSDVYAFLSKSLQTILECSK